MGVLAITFLGFIPQPRPRTQTGGSLIQLIVYAALFGNVPWLSPGPQGASFAIIGPLHAIFWLIVVDNALIWT